jgi:N-methylhydantoinase A
MDMRYGEQVFEITVPLDDVDFRADDVLDQVVERFHARHEELYTYALRDQDVVLVNARVAAVGELPALPAEPQLATRAETPPRGSRRVYLDGWYEVPVYDLDALSPDHVLPGPTLIESATTTVLLRETDTATVTPLGWLSIAIGAPRSSSV